MALPSGSELVQLVGGDQLLNAIVDLNDQFQVVGLNTAATHLLGVSERRVLKQDFTRLFKITESSTQNPLPLGDLLDKGYFHTILSSEKKDSEIHAAISVVHNPSGPGYRLIMYDESVETRIAGKYRSILDEKSNLIASLQSAQTLLTKNAEDLKSLAFVCVFVVNSFAAYALYHSVKSIPPFFNIGSRLLIAGVLILIAYKIKQRTTYTLSSIKHALTIGCFTQAIGHSLTGFSALELDPGLIAFGMGLTPIFMTFIGRYGFGRQTNVYQTAGMFVAVASLFFLFGIGNSSQNINSALMLFGGVFLMSLGTMTSVSGRGASLTLLPIEFIIVGVVLLVVSMISGEFFSIHPDEISESSMAGYVYNLLFTTAISTPTARWLLKIVSPAQAASFFYATPVIGLAIACFAAKTFPDAGALAAVATIVVAIRLIFYK